MMRNCVKVGRTTIVQDSGYASCAQAPSVEYLRGRVCEDIHEELSQRVDRASDTQPAPLQDVRVDHGGPDVAMTQ